MSSDNIAISVNNLSKCYQIYGTPRDRLKQFVFPSFRRMIGAKSKQYYREFWALQDISFSIQKGETVGIIGRNGSGKSTLLQLICGTLSPTSGLIRNSGRIAALLELGSGFNAEFTGRENVRMSCTLLGLSQEEIADRFEDIAAFADIGEFIEQPVKTYSSGMYVRLAFAVNIVSRPDIMVVDEALSVGDMNFQAKCMTALARIQENGATVLFVSHDVNSIKSLCSRGIYLESGMIKAVGKASDVAELYIRNMREEMNEEQRDISKTKNISNSLDADVVGVQPQGTTNIEFQRSDEFEKRVNAFRYGSGGAKIVFAELLDKDYQAIRHIDFDQEVKIVVCFETEIEEEISCNYYIADDKRNLLLGAGMRLAEKKLLKSRQNGRYTCVYKTRLPLQEGNYSIQLQLTRPVVIDQTAEFLDVIDDAIVFHVAPRPEARIWTRVYVPNTLEVIEE